MDDTDSGGDAGIPRQRCRANPAVPAPTGTARRRRTWTCSAACGPGEFADGEKTLRAKIDLASPTHEYARPRDLPHQACGPIHRQGDKWCIYPLYDFAHPIQDAIEGITFSLCSLEFENHRPLYEWVITNIFGTEFPKQREFARLNVTNTVMSKRYLRELVEKNIVGRLGRPPACPP